ncbi:MAG: hypothetical protein MO853_10190 [Candidatus Protistobacter heckmanni]|nr:hypothetical protein [Candidatus Protistobacter heckmanni]
MDKAVAKSGAALSFTVTMSEAVTVAAANGTLAIAFEVGGTPFTATYARGSGTNTLTFTATAPTRNDNAITVQAINLNGSTVTGNVSGQGWVTTVVGQQVANFAVDNTAPTISTAAISGTTSADAAKTGTLVAGDKVKVVLTSSEALTGLAATDKVTLTLDTGGTVDAFWVSSSGNDHTFSYTVATGNLDTDGIALSCLVVSASVKDGAGNALATTLLTASGVVNVAAVAPAAPTILDLLAAQDSGTSSADNLTNATAPTIALTLYDGASSVATYSFAAGAASAA